MKSNTIFPLFVLLLGCLTAPTRAEVIAEWTFNTGTTPSERLASSNVVSGADVSGLSFNDSFTDFGLTVPNDVHDGFGFGADSGQEVIFLHRASYFDNSAVPDPRPSSLDYSSWGNGTQAGTGATLTANGNAPIVFTVTAGASQCVRVEGITVSRTSGADIIFQAQEAGSTPVPGITLNNANPVADVLLATPSVVGPGQTKTFTINLNSGALNTATNINQITLNGRVSDLTGAALAEWTFNAGTTSAERLASSNGAPGATVSALSFNESFSDFGPGGVPNDVHDGIGFGGNNGQQVAFLHRAAYFDNSTVPNPRPTEEDYTSWGNGTEAGTGANLTGNGSAPISFTVTADAGNKVTVESLTVDWTSGASLIVQLQEADATPIAGITFNATNPIGCVFLNAPVVVDPGQTKTFTINLNSGSLNTFSNINGFALNGMVETITDGYQGWATSNGLTEGLNDGFDQNPDFDAFSNGLEWILGGTTPIGFEAIGFGTHGQLLNVESGDGLVFTFKRVDASVGEATLTVQFADDMDFVNGNEVVVGAGGSVGSPPPGVTVDVVGNGSAADDITVTIPASYAGPNGRLFGRLKATMP
jgi:hypothetical protein